MSSPASGTPAPRGGGRSRHRGLLLLLVAVVVAVWAADQASKAFVVAHLEGRPPVPLLGDVVTLAVIRNAGAAFSFATGLTWVFTIVAVVVAGVVVWLSRRLGSVGWTLALALLLGGLLGNLTDRLFRAPGFGVGHVVDFVAVRYFAVFNLADSAICVGAGLVVLLGILGVRLDGTRQRAEAAGETVPGDAGPGAGPGEDPRG